MSVGSAVTAFQASTVPVPVVTLRLERNDPHAGRTFVTNVRLTGGDALGFAHTGDWVEAVGRRRSAYLAAYRCINHTTGAVYDNSPERKMWAVVRVVFVLVIVAIIAFAVAEIIASQRANGAVNNSAKLGQPSIEQCLKSGSPRSFCEDMP